MRKLASLALSGAMIIGLCGGALASTRVRIRGEIAAVQGDALHITTYAGKKFGLTLGPHTRYVSVQPASLSDIKSGEFVGIGTTGSVSHLTALEVVIFPASMRGTGEGHYPWSVPAFVANADLHHNNGSATTAPPVQGTMTNGTVVSANANANSATTAPPVQGTMTNGTVASQSNATAGKELAVSYKGGEVEILVPSRAPVVRLAVATRSVVTPGAKAFAIAVPSSSSSELHAAIVAVGENGLMPPM